MERIRTAQADRSGQGVNWIVIDWIHGKHRGSNELPKVSGDRAGRTVYLRNL